MPDKPLPSGVTPGELARRPDDVGAWIRVDLMTRKVVGRRMEQGPGPEVDEALDRVMILRAWTARRLVS